MRSSLRHYWRIYNLLATDHLIAIVFLSQHPQRWLNDTTSKTQYQVKCGFLLDVVIGQSSAIFQLFTSEYQSLLIWRNTCRAKIIFWLIKIHVKNDATQFVCRQKLCFTQVKIVVVDGFQLLYINSNTTNILRIWNI